MKRSSGEPDLGRFTLGLLPSLTLVSLMATSLGAQTAVSDNPDHTGDVALTNRPSWLNPAQPIELTWGPFDFHPRLSTGLTYDDNILYAANNPESDVISEVSPGIQIVGGDRSSLRPETDKNPTFRSVRISPSSLVIQPSEYWPGKFVVVDYAPCWQFFSQHPVNNYCNQYLTASGVWPMSKLAIGFRQDYIDENTVVVQAYARSEVQTILSELDAGYRLNDRFSLDTALDRQQVSYPGTTNLTGYTEWKGTASLNRQIVDLLNVGLVVAGGWDEVGAGLNQQFGQAGLRMRYEYSTLFSVDGSVGGEIRQFESGRPPFITPVFALGAIYQPWERTSIRFGVARQQYASLNNGYFNTSTGGNVAVRKKLTDRFSVLADLSYYVTENIPNENVSGISQPSDYYAIELKAELKILKHLNAGMYYLFRGSGLFENSSEVRDNQCGVELTLHYQDPATTNIPGFQAVTTNERVLV